ncbi:Fatty acid hydroxylase superfamily protein [Falsiruegeria litorea R37]|uniref:Fatty acid hydroxylase superfamily protein n=1 Tax=Falsiruegeria litorea R37 TaxID=1200284 RepID=A0A1Y5TUR7_9RHOB|nr:sterol desaturase family protein [Falsiruegeria litorea]SLN70198.1 Fatty acid hydroxylase superfamily protein [Falsiruegeria litorea R37]
MTDTTPSLDQMSAPSAGEQMQDMSREWNYHPDLPLKDPSIFQWPPNPAYLIGWLARNWLTLSERVLMAILAVALWYFFYPSLETAQSFAIGWIAQIYVINFVMIFAVAGGLHWYFYIRKGQGKKLKFERRDQGKNNKLWDFSDQVKDNMFWSLGSGVFQLTGFQVVTMWLMANGYAPVITFAENPVWFLAWLVIIPMWSAFHFYWVHRLLHQPFLYKRVHSLHHRNVNIGPWSGFSMHPVEHFIYLTTLCVHWVVASHPIHLYFHIVFQGPGAAMSHAGYEDLLIKDKRKLALGTFYHQLHHRYYECNYGNQEMPWDRWFGTFHDGSPEATAETRARKKRMFG